MKLNLMPIKPVKDGYELLDNACEAILAEPKRLHMGYWLSDIARDDYHLSKTVLAEMHSYPECDTIGCAAGWVVLLSPIPAEDKLQLDEGYDSPVPNIALDQLLPAEAHDARAAFLSFFWDRNGRYRNTDLAPGTLSYARAVVDGLRELQQQYADDLRARTF